ncbi:MAG: hypothetical protein DRQ43_05015 [Gammaproteobacteria bacterium]|nr:MAG: hypothetical protein DRQ43_05015 [Gammaproteobacteria bacterium]
MRTRKRNILITSILSLGLFASTSALAEQSVLPQTPEKKSSVVESAQNHVDVKATDKAEEKRKKITADAISAVNETNQALKLLEEKKTEEALEVLAKITGRLELIMARDPRLALAPVNVRITTFDMLSSLDTIKAIIRQANEYMDDGKIQEARPLIDNLASELKISTTNIPLATYPEAIKAITPLIDEGKIDEAKKSLQLVLNTLVITDEIIPLPVIRAQAILKSAEALAENQQRTEKENETLAQQLVAARNQLKIAELLGYGDKKAFKPIYQEIDLIESKTTDSKGAKGWFEKIKQQLLELVK